MNYIEKISSLLDESDKRLLGDIWSPVVVAVQPEDSRTSMTICPDGELRSYGKRWSERHNRFENIYLSSRSAGLSWKTVYDSGDTLGRSVESPYSGDYVVLRAENDGLYALKGKSPDDCCYTRKKLADGEFIDVFPPLPLRGKKRWIATMHSYDGECQHPIVALSDDDGESWTLTTLETTAPFEIKPPHKGLRWQNRGAEPTVTELNDGTLALLMRTSLDNLYIAFSRDFGETWSSPRPSRFRSTLTTPAWLRMSDGRLLLFWNNTRPLPELDHDLQWPPCDYAVKAGLGEDVFTNRDANHCAIFDDAHPFNAADFTLEGEGGEWTGFRELYLNEIRNHSDFRMIGGRHGSIDKSIQQFQAIELPMNKILLQFGQNSSARRTVIFDVAWLYEKSRAEDLQDGLVKISTQVYVKSYNGCSSGHGYRGHCAWNRTNGALLVPSPELDHREVLKLSRTDDPDLFSNTQGAVWNFPAAKRGAVKLTLRVNGGPLALSLCDAWYNPIDSTPSDEAQFSIDIASSELAGGEWTSLTLTFDTEKGECEVKRGEEKFKTLLMRGRAKNGLSYLHLRNAAEAVDYNGVLIREITFEGK